MDEENTNAFLSEAKWLFHLNAGSVAMFVLTLCHISNSSATGINVDSERLYYFIGSVKQRKC